MKTIKLTVVLVAMCPDKKMQWFVDHGWESDAIEEVCRLVIGHWGESYKPTTAANAAVPAAPANIPAVIRIHH